MIPSQKIRQQFIDFFISKEHTFIKSSPVVPLEDPTLLFTNAGMNQFKDIFLGKKETELKRAVNSQKCIRAGGKHNDLDEVGKDGFHHTFFEMLGNWSFGDFYKREAIEWAWELLTEIWKLPKDKIHATVYLTDDEAFELWKEHTDIDPTHITRHGDKDNFWEMGETGPCGPCSELHLDRGIEFCNLKDDKSHICTVNGDCQRYIELWNLVFIQFLRNDDRSLTPLKHKFVDTGAGFERLCQVLQNVDSNYKTDVFLPIIKEIDNIRNHSFDTNLSQTVAHRVIADHIRTLCFAIADGGIPANEGRGYVLRRILRRAARYGRNLNFKEPFLYKLVDCVVLQMGDYFQELKANTDSIKNIIKAEEEKFNQTLDKGLSIFQDLVRNLKSETISGLDAFILYDTYGFPLDLTKILAEEKGLSIDENGFEQEMMKQKQRARESSNFKLKSSDVDWIYVQDSKTNPTCNSDVYNINKECYATIIKYTMLNEDGDVGLVLSDTIFYAESGGQIHDTGRIYTDKTEIEIYNVQKLDNIIVHYGKIVKGEIDNLTYKVEINKTSRQDIARNHTATHLLHSTLRNVLGNHVQQKGSLVTKDRLRFDFTHFTALTHDEIMKIESLINFYILECYDVVTEIKTLQQAKDEGAIALFGEKYEDEVRVVSINSPIRGMISKELCGGTHVSKTGQIGLFKISSESSIASGVRRIEAITGLNSENYVTNLELKLSMLYDILSANENNIVEKTEKLFIENKALQQEIEKLKLTNTSGVVDELMKNVFIINSIKCLACKVSVTSTDDLKILGDKIKEKLESGIGVAVAEIDGKVSIIVVVTNDLTKRFSAGKIVSELAMIVDGKGGGRPDMAMAGGKSVEKIDYLMKQIHDIIQKLM